MRSSGSAACWAAEVDRVAAHSSTGNTACEPYGTARGHRNNGNNEIALTRNDSLGNRHHNIREVLLFLDDKFRLRVAKKHNLSAGLRAVSKLTRFPVFISSLHFVVLTTKHEMESGIVPKAEMRFAVRKHDHSAN